MSVRYTVRRTASPSDAPAAAHTTDRFSRHWRTCSPGPSPTSWPLSASSGIWPEQNNSPPARTAWEYGPTAGGAPMAATISREGMSPFQLRTPAHPACGRLTDARTFILLPSGREPQRPGAGDIPIPAPAPRQPGRLAAVGTGRARRGPRARRAAACLDRLLGLPLVPRHGARVLRGPRDRRAHERAVRQRQGRPRGAPRRRRHLHGGGSGDHRLGRLAAERLRHPRPGPVLRWHLLPAAAGAGDAELAPGPGRSSRCLGEPPRLDPRAGAEDRRAPAHQRTASGLGRADHRRGARRRGDAPARELRRDPRRLGRGAQVPRGEAEMALETLRKMAAGGMYDQVGGGFHRYSVDAAWRVPHFEKMLYDNALLARAYLHGWQISGDARLRDVVEQTLDWALREMRGPEGAFYSALDADSEGEEGLFYTWTPQELREQGAEPETFPFEGRQIVLAPVPADVRRRLLEVRSGRVRPGTDDKRLTSWNALMVSALAEAEAVLERPDYVEAARTAADFLLTTMGDERGGLLRTYNLGEAKLPGLLADHAFMLEALVTIYEATFEERWYVDARALADHLIERFADRESGGFWSTPPDHGLLARRKDLEDTPIPAGGSSAAFGLLRLAALSGEHDLAAPA